VLVGHSFGGFNVRVFNGNYSAQVVGLVLVDATQEDQYRLLPTAWSDMGAAMRRRAARQAFWAPLYVDLGLARLQLRFAGPTSATPASPGEVKVSNFRMAENNRPIF
jgi:pimeloyl-ACP methyl ester carboxylesterase